MPLDPASRRELQRLRGALTLTAGLASNPFGVVLGWLLEPVHVVPDAGCTCRRTAG